MDIPVLINPECVHLHRVRETVEIISQIQRHFRLSLVEVDYLFNSDKKVAAEQIWRLVEKHSPDKLPAIVVMQNPLDTGWFSTGFRKLHIISTSDLEETCAPPPLKIYLAYQFAEALLYFAVDLPEVLIGKWAHDPAIGCFFDLVVGLDSLRLGMTGANLCGECEAKLFGMGLTHEALQSVEQILMFVRGATIRRARKTASYVFIGHGRSGVWSELATYLSDEFGLIVEEFNRESTAGIATTERLKQMLEYSRFAFLVMTAEDLHADKKVHARENVVHEIGLFQGRLGFEKAIILKEEGVAGFSNIHGLTYIPFPKGKLNATAKKEIRRTLERERIIGPMVLQRERATKKRQRNRAVVEIPSKSSKRKRRT